MITNQIERIKNTVSVTVEYGSGGMIDCEKAAEKWAEIFSKELGFDVKGNINPGDSCCGILFETTNKADADTLQALFEQQINPEATTAREIFPIAGDIIRFELDPQNIDDIQSIHAQKADGRIDICTHAKGKDAVGYGEHIPDEEMDDYLKGGVIVELNLVDKNGKEATPGGKGNKGIVIATLIPHSRLEEIKESAKYTGVDMFELGRRLGKIGTKFGEFPLIPEAGNCGVEYDRKIGGDPNAKRPPVAWSGHEMLADQLIKNPDKYRTTNPSVGAILEKFLRAATGKEGKISQANLKKLETPAKELLDAKGYVKRDVFKTLSDEDKERITPLVKEYATSLRPEI